MKARAQVLVRRRETPSDGVVERLNDDAPRDLEPAALMVPDLDAEIVADLGEAKVNITGSLKMVVVGYKQPTSVIANVDPTW